MPGAGAAGSVHFLPQRPLVGKRAGHARTVREAHRRRVRQQAWGCERRKLSPLIVAERVGRLLGGNTRAVGLFEFRVETDAQGKAGVHWRKRRECRDWAALGGGCYLLPRKVAEWSAEEPRRAHAQLTEVEAVFRIQK